MPPNPQFGCRQLEYTAAREETLPPIHELLAEHKRMKEEMAAAGAAEKQRFENMMTAWAQRARAGVAALGSAVAGGGRRRKHERRDVAGGGRRRKHERRDVARSGIDQ